VHSGVEGGFRRGQASAPVAALQPFHEGDETGRATQRVEVAVVIEPALLPQAGAHCLFETVDGVVEHAGERVDAGDVVEHHGLGGVDGQGEGGPLETPLDVAESDQTVEGAIIALDDDQRMRWALMSVPSISFYRYQISFKLVKG